MYYVILKIVVKLATMLKNYYKVTKENVSGNCPRGEMREQRTELPSENEVIRKKPIRNKQDIDKNLKRYCWLNKKPSEVAQN